MHSSKHVWNNLGFMEFSKQCIYGREVKDGVAGVVGTFENALIVADAQTHSKQY